VTGGRIRISPWQLVVLVFTLGLCVTPFAYPERVDEVLGRSAWIPGVAATAVGIWGTAVALGLARRFPGVPFDRAVRDLLGPALAYPYLAALAALFLAGAPANLRIFTGVAGSRALPYLPLVYPAVLVGGTGVLAAYGGADVIARTAEALAPFAGLGLVFVFAAPLYNAHLGYLLPLGTVGWSAQAARPALTALGTVRGFLPLLILGPLCRPLPRARGLLAASASAGLLVTVSLALPVAVFGAPFARTLLYPFLSAVGTVGWNWLPTQRLVELTLLVWQAVAFVVFATYLWLGAWLLRRLVPALPWTFLVLAAGTAGVLAAALDPPSRLWNTAVDVWNGAVLLLGVIVPTALWGLSARRGRTAATRPVTGG
jgi:hypothetical protein